MVLFSDSFLPKYFDLANCVKKNISIKKTPVQVKYLLGDILAWADITEYHRVGALNNRNVFSHNSRNQKSKTHLLENSVPGEAFFPGL